MTQLLTSAEALDAAFDMAPDLMNLILDHDDPAVPVLAMCLTLGVFAQQLGTQEVLENITHSVREAYFNSDTVMRSSTKEFPASVN